MKKRFLAMLFFLSYVLVSIGTRAEIKIDVTGAQSDPLPFALPVFATSGYGLSDTAEEMTEVIVNDLERSGLFRHIDKNAYIQNLKSVNDRPVFQDWQAINAQALIYGTIKETMGNLNVSFRIFDVYAQTQLDAKSFTADSEAWRKLAHMIADSIYERVTGEKGYFDTRVAFIDETGNQMNRRKRLAIMDQDGANLVYLTSGEHLTMTPRFSPNMKEVTYFSYHDGKPKVYLMDVETRDVKLVGNFKGMTFAPRFSPDGKKLVISLTKRGNSDIYTYDLKTGYQKQLTNHPSINTSPSYSPEGDKIVFNSDRSGNQQLYIMNADGSGVHRISFGEGTYATPVWSPRGDYIAFTKIRHGQFHIGVIKPDGTGERLITNGFLVESPSWAPNGRVLMFYRKSPSRSDGSGGESKLYTIDITGYNERELITPHSASAPAWSPLLH